MKKLILTLLLLPLLATAGDAAQTLLSVDLRQEPFVDAPVLAKLPAGTAVEVVKRHGGWLQVKTAETDRGWLKMSSVRLGAGAAEKGDSGLGSLFNVAVGGRSGNTGVTVATGVRGLSPEDIKNAKPAPEGVKKMDSFPGGRNEGQSFASSGKLKNQQVEYFAEANSVIPAGGNSFTSGGNK